MKAIILAAGYNKRLKNVIDYPKVLLKVGKQTILEKQLEALKSVGLTDEDIIVVTGYKQSMIKKYHSNVVYNKDYRKYDNARSVYLGLSKIDGDDVLILDGDLVVDKKIIKDIVNNKHVDVVLGKEHRDELFFTYDNDRVEYMAIPSKKTKVFTYGGIIKLSAFCAQVLKTELKNKTKWYTIPLTDMMEIYNFYVLKVDKNYKCFDIDVKEDIKKLK